MKQVKALFLLCLKYFFWVIVIVNAGLIFYKSLEYYPADFTRGFLSDKEGLFSNTIYPIFFYGHITISSLILILGVFQFNRKFRNNNLKIHRQIGKLYVFLVVFISAPSAFVMGVYATGSWFIKGGFAVVSVLWWWYTYNAYIKIRSGEVEAHERFMIRSYIISLLAVFLRVYYYFLVGVLEIESPYTYTIVVYASWLPNLLLYELYLWIRERNKQTVMQ